MSELPQYASAFLGKRIFLISQKIQQKKRPDQICGLLEDTRGILEMFGDYDTGTYRRSIDRLEQQFKGTYPAHAA